MADNERIVVEIDFETKSATAAFNQIGREATRTGTTAARNFEKSFTSFIPGIKTALAGLATAVAGAFATKQVVDASNQQRDAINSLNAALRNSGQLTQETSQDLQNYASQLQQTTRFGDELIIQQQAIALSFGATADQAKLVTGAAIELAEAQGKTLEEAVRQISKTLGGFAGELGETIPALKELTQEQLRAGEGIRIISESFQGFGAAAATTFSGRTQQLTNAFGDLLEAVGDIITQSPVLRQLLATVTQAIVSLTNSIQSFAGQGDLIGNLITRLVDFGRAINTFVVAPLEFAVNISQVAFNGLVSGINRVISAIASGAGKVANFLDSLGLETGLSEQLEVLGQSTAQVFEESFADFEAAKNRIFDFPGAVKSEEFLTKLQETADAAAPIAEQLNESVGVPVKNLGDQFKFSMGVAKQATVDASNTIKGALVRTISTGIQQLSQSLVKGTFSFKEFQKQVLTIIGDMSIKIGESAIATGIAMEAIGKLSGTAAIIAGAGLIALGAIIKSFAGGGASGASGGVAAGGGGGAGIPSPETTQVIEPVEEREEAQTFVGLTVNGDVLDSEETGTRLVSILNEAFDQQGVVVNGQGVA